MKLKHSVGQQVRLNDEGLRSACTYTGSRSLKELPKRTTFCKVNQQISTLYGVGELMS